jgi:glycosyltransferase involved in cell wall biosynthesis
LHTNALNERGATVAISDYAKGLSKAGHDISIAYSALEPSNLKRIAKQIGSRFPTYAYTDFHLFAAQNAKKWDVGYFIKYGNNDGKLIPGIPNIIHAVFQSYDPHGDAYLYVSEWLAQKMRVKNLKNLVKLSPKGLDSLKLKSFKYLPHIVSLPIHERTLREIWGVPEEAIIGGRHGGRETFDVPDVHRAIHELLEENRKLYFVFANTNQFINHPRVKFLPTLSSRLETSEYLSSLDFFVHARHRGETFGLSLLEAMSKKVPVYSYSKGVDGNHRYLLRGSKNSLFDSGDSLKIFINQLQNYEDIQTNFEVASSFSPELVMQHWSQILTELVGQK